MTFNVVCLKCGEKFKAKRSTAKFCSPTCRKAFSRTKHKEGQKVLKKFKKHITQQNSLREKGYPLNNEEKEYVKLGILNKEALLKAPKVTRKTWVRDARIYKPTYLAMGEYIGKKSRYKPHYLTFGAGV